MSGILNKTITDLQLAGYRPKSMESCSYQVFKFLEYFNKDPLLISDDELKLYFLLLKHTKNLSASATAQAICGIKFLLVQKTLLCPNCGSVLQWVQKLEPG